MAKYSAKTEFFMRKYAYVRNCGTTNVYIVYCLYVVSYIYGSQLYMQT